jgi:carboxylesterase
VYLPLLIAAASVAGGLLWRHRYSDRLERELRRRLRLADDGIVVGGEPFEYDSAGDRGALLIHGAGDTPQTLRYLGEYLRDRGFAVRAPLLPGHGRTLRHFSEISAGDLLAAVTVEHARMARRYPRVAVVGLSMGGALAVRLAAAVPELPALVLLAPYLAMRPRLERLARTSGVWGHLVPLLRTRDPRSIRDPREVARNVGYGVISAAALRALLENAEAASAVLGSLRAPTLVVQSREDNRVDAVSCERAFAALGSPEKKLVWVEGAGHVISVDYGRERVFREVGEWLERWIPATVKGEAPSGTPPPPPPSGDASADEDR